MEPLSFLAKFFDSSWKVGFAFAIGVSITFALRLARIEPFASLDPSWFSVLAVAGVIGLSFTLVEGLILISQNLKSKNMEWGRGRARRRNAIKNLDTMTQEQALALLFLRRNNMKRFFGPCQNTLLLQLIWADLLTIDDPNFFQMSTNTYYLVPDYVWDQIDSRLDGLPTPAHAPWLPTPEQEWLRYGLN
jgi:hypothetical protein